MRLPGTVHSLLLQILTNLLQNLSQEKVTAIPGLWFITTGRIITVRSLFMNVMVCYWWYVIGGMLLNGNYWYGTVWHVHDY